MAQPTPYDRLYNFVEYATANPGAPYQPAYTDAELNAIQQTLEEVLINLSLIQRDDRALKNGVVTQDSLSSSVAALLTASGGTIKGAWLTATAYVLRDVVTQGVVTYICAVAHTSGTFATDLAASKWVALNTGSTVAASAVTSSPSGDIIATNVDAAIAELASKKLAKAQNLADLANRVTAFGNLVAAGGTMTGALTFSGARVNEAQATDIASATAAGTLNLDGAAGNLVDVTGTTAVTDVKLSQGREAVVRFTGALLLTNGASLVLPTGENITTAAGDIATFRGYATGVVRCVGYMRYDGTALVANSTSATITTPTLNGAVAGSSLAAQSDMETATSTSLLMTPGVQKYHPGTVKGWGVISHPTTVSASYPSAGVSNTNPATGNYVVTHGLTMSSTTYGVFVTAVHSAFASERVVSRTATTFTVQIEDAAGSATNPTAFTYLILGDL